MTCWLYVIAEVANGGTDHPSCKIGISKDVASRLSGLQFSSPRKLEVRASWEFIDASSARDFERTIHRRLVKHRSHGEWFAMKPALAISHIAKLITQLRSFDGYFEIDGRHLRIVRRDDDLIDFMCREDVPYGVIFNPRHHGKN